MVCDALTEADQAMRFTDDIWRPETFLALDDTLLKRVGGVKGAGLDVEFCTVRQVGGPAGDTETCSGAGDPGFNGCEHPAAWSGNEARASTVARL